MFGLFKSKSSEDKISDILNKFHKKAEILRQKYINVNFGKPYENEMQLLKNKRDIALTKNIT
tara:strand:- start:2451 stop:2636 length:186 start_codon:yes stop_codon:yes gene_type:complete